MSKRRPTATSYSQGTRGMARDHAGPRMTAKEIETLNFPDPEYVAPVAPERVKGNEARCSSCNRLLFTWEIGPEVPFEQRTKCARCKSVLTIIVSSTMIFARVRVVA